MNPRHILRRCFVEGGGVSCLAAIGPGETILPVTDVAWYPAGGGLVALPNQRLTYTAAVPSPGGALVGPGAGPSNAPTVNGAVGAGLGTGGYTYAYTDVTALGESLPSPLGSFTTGLSGSPISPPSAGPTVTTSAGTDPWGNFLQQFRISFVTASGETTAGPIGSVTTPGNCLLTLSNIPIGPAGTTAREIYRIQSGGTGNIFLISLNDNTTTTLNIVSPYGTLYSSTNQQGPTSNTAYVTYNQVALSAIVAGPATTTSRKIYRTAVGGSQLKLLTTLANNTTTTYADATGDGSLGANVPTSDTSGLAGQSNGQVTAGSGSLLTSNATAFSASGGWAVLPGQAAVRYTGLSGNTLTGIPASGPGAIQSTVTYGSSVMAAHTLTGIPASGPGAILYPILVGDPVNLLAQVDDLAAQAALSALLDPSNLYGGARGIQEDYFQDGTIGYTEAHARGLAQIALRKLVDVKVRYQTRDVNTRAGRTIVITLPAPYAVANGTFTIQDVQASVFGPHANPTYDATAASTRFSFEDLLRQAGG